MADTSRTLAALQTLLADNTSNAISPQDIRDFLVSAMGGYGMISTTGASTAQGMTTSFAKLTTFTANGISNNTTPDHTNDQITVGVAGDYEVRFIIHATGASATTFTFAPSVNGTESTVYQFPHTTTGTESFYVTGAAYLTLAASDVITVEGKAGGSINLTVKDSNLSVKRLS